MHVAHLLRKYNPAEWGGTETVIQQLFDGLRRRGVDSVVYCPALDATQSNDPLADAGCEVKRFRACVPVIGISPEQRRQMIAVGGNLLSFDLLQMLWTDQRCAVIHSHTLGRIGGVGLTMARRKKLPFVLTIHGGVYDLPESMRKAFSAPMKGWEWGKAFGMLVRARHVLNEADAVITCNPREAQLIQERHPQRRVMVQPHGVPARIYNVDHRQSALAAFPMLERHNVVLSLGRIDPVKNQAWLVRQLPELLRRHPSILLVLAGACTDEAYGRSLEQQVRELGLENHVVITGKLPPADPRLIGLLQLARVCVLQSISETFGMVILEAWAAGTPAISSRTSGPCALIEHGRNGCLFDLERPETFHEAIDAVLNSEMTRARMVAAGRERVVSDYDTAVLAGRMKELYRELYEEKYALHTTA
jgi:alpha-maltose-1-phosphate synthase